MKILIEEDEKLLTNSLKILPEDKGGMVETVNDGLFTKKKLIVGSYCAKIIKILLI